MDEEIERTQKLIDDEVNKIIKDDEKKKKKPYDLDIDFNEYDEIFDLKEDKDLPEVKIDDKEIKAMYAEYERQIDKEIEKELIAQYKPSTFEGDEERAEKLLQNDDLIATAVKTNIISKEEVIMFVDYYEIFSLMNKCNKFTLNELQMMENLKVKNIKKETVNKEEGEEEEEYEDEEEEEDEDEDKKEGKEQKVLKEELNKNEEDDPIKKLMNEIESKLNASENILSKRLDYDKLLYHKGEFITQVKPKPVQQPQTPSSKSNNINVNKSITSFSSRENTKAQIPIEELLKIPKFTSNSNGFILNKKTTLKLKPTPKLQKIELFNDNAQATNLIKQRSNRREIVKAKMSNKGSIRKELFQFKSKMTKEENEKFREKMIQLFDIKKDIIAKSNLDPNRKSTLRKKIEEAQNFSKTKSNYNNKNVNKI